MSNPLSFLPPPPTVEQEASMSVLDAASALLKLVDLHCADSAALMKQVAPMRKVINDAYMRALDRAAQRVTTSEVLRMLKGDNHD